MPTNYRAVYIIIAGAISLRLCSMQDQLNLLRQAATTGDLSKVQILDPEGTNPVFDDGWTPLHVATENGHFKLVAYYVKKLEAKNQDISPTRKDHFELIETPLEIAAYKAERVDYRLSNGKLKYFKIVKYLSHRGCTISREAAYLLSPDTRIAGPDYGVENYLQDIAPLTQQLLKECDKVKILSTELKGYQEKLIKTHNARMKPLFGKLMRGCTITIESTISIIDALLKQGAEISAQGKGGYSALHIFIDLCNSKKPALFDEFTRNLIDRCAKHMVVSDALNAETDKGDTPLSLAAQHGNSRIVKYLLKKGADCTIGKNFLTTALEHNNGHILRYLLMGPEKQPQFQNMHDQKEQDINVCRNPKKRLNCANLAKQPKRHHC